MIADAARYVLAHALELAIGIEFALAIVISALNVRELHFLATLRPLLPDGEDLPLYDALTARAAFLMVTGFYLIVLSVLTTLGLNLTLAFPPLRILNGALFLAILAGPVFLGHAMRRSPRLRELSDTTSGGRSA